MNTKLHRFYFPEPEPIYVTAYNLTDAIKYYKEEVKSEYRIVLPDNTDIEVTDEGELPYDTIDVWEEKYNVESYDGETLLDKHDYWTMVQKIFNETPGRVWSSYDSGEIVCGMHTVDVIGFYITETEGFIGEIYGHYEGSID